MDIVAAIFAYLVGVAGVVGALVISFVIFFSPSQAQLPLPAPPPAAMLASPDPVTTIAAARSPESRAKIAADVRQKSALSRGQLRHLSEKERARRLVLREGSSFEDRFLNYAD